VREIYRRAAEALGAKIVTERSEEMATRTNDTEYSKASWVEWRRCRETVPQHLCREGCYWIAEPIDADMTSRIVLVTPTIAKSWLRRNDKNRTFTRNAARILAAEMGRGHWRENGESVVFDTDGVLVDGQHRLQAVLNSGHSYRVPVITGIEPEVRPTVDTGVKRSAANNLQMADEQNTATLAATLMLWRGYDMKNVSAMTYPAAVAPENRVTTPKILEYLEEWPDIREAVRVSLALRPSGQGRALVPSSEAAMIWYAIVRSGASRESANEFLGSVLAGFDLAKGNPIIGLRRRLIDNLGVGQRMDKRERLALVLKTWLLWSTGQTRKVIKWEHASEPFPFLD